MSKNSEVETGNSIVNNNEWATSSRAKNTPTLVRKCQHFIYIILLLKTKTSNSQETKTGFHTRCGKYKFQQNYDL